MPKVSEIMESMEYGPAPEDASAVRDWLRERGSFGHFIAGRFTRPGVTFASRDPSTGDELAQVTQGTARDVMKAVRAARRAQRGWGAMPGHDRARFLYAIARTIQKRERFLSVLESLDNGKPIRESRDIDVPLVVRHFYHHAGWAELAETEFPGHRPLGVCGQVIPWNFPLLMLAWKVAPALAAGNTVVLKPAEYTPLTALAFAEICAHVGLPAGVVNIVTGDGETGAALVRAPVDKIAFTGSTEVGRGIARAVAGSGKRLTLELGGKSPFVVLEDADLDAAVEGVVDSIWFNQGEVCCAGSRILVAESVAARFEALLRARMQKLRLGAPLDKSTDIGAIVDPVQKDRILRLIDRATAAGAELVGGAAAPGCFIAPGYLKNISPANPGMVEEIFGPIATLSTFRTPDEAVDLANNTRYGLAASVWSESATVATDLAARIKAGVVWVNCANLFDAAAPFGGMRDSGYGREGGREGMLDYLAAPVAPQRDPAPSEIVPAEAPEESAGIDRTVKLYIGGAQKRPDGGASYAAQDELIPLGNRKDIRNAVEAAQGGLAKWQGLGGHGRAQVLYFLAENLAQRRAEFAGFASPAEVDAAIRRCFFYAGFADKYDGATVSAKPGHLCHVQPEPHGVMGLIAPVAAPLAGFMALVLPAIAMGNAVVAIPSQDRPMAALTLAQVLACSDVPGGVVNIVTGPRDDLVRALAGHDGVSAIWHAGLGEGLAEVQRVAAETLIPVWTPQPRDWSGPQAQGREFLRAASRTKTIWLPYGALPAGTGSSAY
ncbi:aldehyde dehydrogenase family protein [Paracoccus denitrificans]|jgi:aldehyde dehydrogenase (NAD+)|uniref:Aldehyde dehydrogenase (NAD(+)) n=1 Tax=Paracoccus denitrificans (strain Pd 1222) TaxID=318586 RepID=A1B8X0_PARDP|nr:aldehyde dehydrogenase family protein [Paracoccus denitrificans]ABL71964.1 Aldehyde dehydrogenase (NAD(+)) [Paracoccus denitrificans PD1222]MBB4626132.1 aldehyde dehydrogenase (NAD+) [Paracoccus denitrificans]MCU7430580.1 aldehyde dehydrogenase family protein [Paracoccus denitrificans]QAR28546.1 aldehyde dehydrogenase family protein [Paracoccus denitrificans]UPV96689.1 aldehyde dehydrogenase family protein [Paracoccus denitrificans]